MLTLPWLFGEVSIQLVSLARREMVDGKFHFEPKAVSIQLVSLARREVPKPVPSSVTSLEKVSIQLVSLARREQKKPNV